MLNFFKKARKHMEWSKGKAIVAYGPTQFGHHFMFVDYELNVAVFLPKADGNLYVLTGNPIKAMNLQKYDDNRQKIINEEMRGSYEWKITPEAIYYRGSNFPKQGPPHKAEIRDVTNFREFVNQKFIFHKAAELHRFMHEKGELPIKADFKWKNKPNNEETDTNSSESLTGYGYIDYEPDKGPPEFAIPGPDGREILGGGGRTLPPRKIVCKECDYEHKIEADVTEFKCKNCGNRIRPPITLF